MYFTEYINICCNRLVTCVVVVVTNVVTRVASTSQWKKCETSPGYLPYRCKILLVIQKMSHLHVRVQSTGSKRGILRQPC